MTIPFFGTLLFLAYLLTILQSAWVSEILPNFLKPDLMLIFVIYMGTLPHLLPGAILVASGALLYELFSGCPAGLCLLIYLTIFFLLKFLSKFIIIGGALSFRLLLVFLGLILQCFLFAFLPFVFGIWPKVSLPEWAWILPQAAATSLLGWPIWIFFKKVETFPPMTPPPESA